MSKPDEERNPMYLTTDECAQLTRRSLRAVHELTRRNAIPLRQPSGTGRILHPRSELLEWLDGCALETVILPGGGRVVRPLREAA